MFSQDDISTLYGFLRSTSEQNLKKMLLGGQMNEAYFKVLMKVVRATTEAEFIQHFEAASFPKIKMSAQEIPMKETLWPICAGAFVRLRDGGRGADRREPAPARGAGGDGLGASLRRASWRASASR